MTLDDRLGRSLSAAYRDGIPATPPALPDPARSRSLPYAAGTVGVLSVAAVVAGVAVSSTAGGGHHSTALQPATSPTSGAVPTVGAGTPYCGPDDVKVVVQLNHTSIPRSKIDGGIVQSARDRQTGGPGSVIGYFQMTGELVATRATPCRAYGELSGVGTTDRPLVNGGGAATADRVGVEGTPPPMQVAVLPFPPAVPTLPLAPMPSVQSLPVPGASTLSTSGSGALVPVPLLPVAPRPGGVVSTTPDHGFRLGTGGATTTLGSAALQAAMDGKTDPAFSTITRVGYQDDPDLQPGHYTAQVTYGPWSGTEDFTITDD